MRQNDRRRRLFKTFTACLLAVAMLLSNVMGAVEVWAEDIVVKEPTVNDVLYDATTISGANLAKAKVKVNGKNKTVIATVHVILKGEGGTVKATLSDSPTSGTTWKVDLPEGVKVAKGDKVTVYQQIGEVKSQEVTKDAQPSKASTVTLTMPTGEFWVEEYVANVLNDDEKAEAIDLLKKVNPDIANDISSVDFVIEGIDSKTASYTVTYKDKSKTEKIPAPGLTIKKVTETSRSPEIDSITIVDNVVKGKLPGPGPFDGIKVQLVIKVNKDKAGQYCNENKCTVDKDSSNPVGVTLQNDGTFSYTLKAGESLKLDQIVGVSVKEPHKFVSCSTTTVKPVIPEKTEVKDPRKLTDKDKKAIDAAIKKGYTVNGVSKLPNGTGDWDGVPAVIQIDDSGNVKIFSGNDVKGDWDNDGNFVPEKNDDGSVKINDGAEPKITIPAKDLVKNIAPKSPAIAVDTDKGEVTITPPAYKDPGDDTDLLSYTITYKDNSGAEKTVTATRDLVTNKWSGSGVDADTGVITLSVENIELAGTIKATAKDNGGLEGDTDKLDSDPATKKLETATVSYDANKGTGEMKGKTVNKGSKYEILSNAFTAPDNQEFKAWEVDGKEVAPNSEITVSKDTVVKAIWKKIQATVSYDANGGKGTMEGKTVDKGSEYTVLPNAFTAPDDTQEFKAWEVDGKEVAPGTEITVDKDTVVKAIWKDKAPAVKEFKVTFNGNGGTDKMDPITVKKGQQFELPKNGFTAPKGKVFAGWQIAQAPNKVFAPGTTVTVNGNIEVKAIWKDITSQDPSQPGKPGSGTYYKGSTLIMPNRATEPVKPAKEMEIGRHIRYLYGYEDRTVRPQGKITRAEAAALIARLAELDMSDKSKPDFADTPSAWYNSAINIMVKKDLMFGDKNGNFRPSEPITRGEFARALLYIDAKNDKVAPFADVKGHKFEEAINQAFGNGRINGYPDGTFRPDDYIQRAEAARMLNQYANRGTTLEGMAPVAKDLARFTDIDESHWAYCEIMEAANSHEYQRVKGTQAETWLKILYDDMKK